MVTPLSVSLYTTKYVIGYKDMFYIVNNKKNVTISVLNILHLVLFCRNHLMNDMRGRKELSPSRSTIPVITSAASCQRFE